MINWLFCQLWQKGSCLIWSPNQMFNFTFVYIIISLFLFYNVYILIKKTFYIEKKKVKYKWFSIFILIISIYFILTSLYDYFMYLIW